MDTKKCSDYELVKEFIKGNKYGIELLIARHQDKVFNYIQLLVKSEALAEDIFQETFFKVIRSLKKGKYRDNGKFVSWVLRIAHNLVIDHFRKSNQMKVISNDNYENDIFNTQSLSEATIEEVMSRTQVNKEVRTLVDSLPEDQKEVVILRHYVGLSFKEIAEFTNVSINTALGRMRYAILNMRKTVDEKKISLVV